MFYHTILYLLCKVRTDRIIKKCNKLFVFVDFNKRIDVAEWTMKYKWVLKTS